MTIEIALSGLSMSLFYALTTLLLVGLFVILSTVLVYLFIKISSLLLKSVKKGIDDLKETAKELTATRIKPDDVGGW